MMRDLTSAPTKALFVRRFNLLARVLYGEIILVPVVTFELWHCDSYQMSLLMKMNIITAGNLLLAGRSKDLLFEDSGCFSRLVAGYTPTDTTTATQGKLMTPGGVR